MNINEVFFSVHNLGTREAIRRFQPKYSVLVVSPDGDVVEIDKHKVIPEFSKIGSLLDKHAGCGAFIASDEMYPTKEELQDRVLSMASKLRDKETGKIKPNKKRGLVGTTYYGGPKKG